MRLGSLGVGGRKCRASEKDELLLLEPPVTTWSRGRRSVAEDELKWATGLLCLAIDARRGRGLKQPGQYDRSWGGERRFEP